MAISRISGACALCLLWVLCAGWPLPAADLITLSEPIPLIEFDLQVEWRMQPKAAQPQPAPVVESPSALPFLPLVYMGTRDLAVSDDGMHVLIRSGVLYDLRLRSQVDLGRIANPGLRTFEDGFAYFRSHRLQLKTGEVTLLPDQGPRVLQVPRLLGEPGAALPRLAGSDIGACSELETCGIPGTPYAVSICGNTRATGTWLACLLDVQRRLVLACVRNAKPLAGGPMADFMPHRLMLGLSASSRLDAAARTALTASGAYRRKTTILWDNRMLGLRIQDGRVVADVLSPPAADIREMAWSADGSTVCTRQDDRLQTWTREWVPLASMPILADAGLGGNSSPPGTIQAIMDAGGRTLNPVVLDCRTLTCERDPRRSAIDPLQVSSRSFPDGTVAVSGRWPGREIRLCPPELDWRKIRDVVICADATGVVVTDEAVYVTRLPDGAPRRISQGLPGPPYGILSDPAGATVLLLNQTSVTSIDVAKGAVSGRKPLRGDAGALASLMTRQEARVQGRCGVGDRFYDVFRGPLFSLHLITQPFLWPRFVNHEGTLILDAEAGTVARGQVPLFETALASLPGWRAVTVSVITDPRGSWPVQVRNAGGKMRWALVDPTGRTPAVLVPDMPDVDPHRARRISGSTWAVDGGGAGGICVWNGQSGGWAMLYPQLDGAVVAWSDDGYFAVPRQYADTLTMRIDGASVRCGAFDLQLNRPDKVLERIGLADPSYLALLRAAWERRVRKAGQDPEQLRHPGDLARLPRVRLVAPLPAGRTSEATVMVHCQVTGPVDLPITLAVRVGGMVVERRSVTAAERGGTIPIAVALQAGVNEIEIEPGLEDGSTGLMAMVSLVRGGQPCRVRVAALGVSAYREPGRELAYAATDARDVAAALAPDDPERTLVLTDEQVRREALPGIRTHLAKATLDDLAVVMVAAHGLIDGKGGYFIAAHDTEFADPAARGIALESLLEVLRASPARRRLLLIDCCHAGELDPEDAVAPSGDAAGARARGLRVLPAQDRPAPPVAAPADASPSPPTPGQVARAVFLDVGWTDGITVLAACRGNEASWESPAWGHGAFSQAVIDGARGRLADANADGLVDLAELGRYVMGRVAEMTGGRQHPELRAGKLDRNVLVIPAK